MKNLPMDRRQFLAAAVVVSGGAVLSQAVPSGASAASGFRPFGDSPYASPDGTTIPSATEIIDNGGNTWTVNGGVIYRNGSTVENTCNVSLLLWYGGRLYHRGTGGQFYAYNYVWRICTDPRIPIPAQPGTFYGMNGHPDSGLSAATVANLLDDLGCSIYRLNVVAGTWLNEAVPIAQELQSKGIKLFPVINLSPDINGVLFANESAAYHYGFDGAAAVATALQPHGVTMYECGNELTRKGYMLVATNDAGTKVSGWNNTNWPLMRGVMRGMIDGVKSVQPDALCGINFCRTDTGASDALWDGDQPDGSGGHQPLRWDITTWHNYEGDGDIFHIISDGAGPSLSVPVHVKARYGKPFMMTEWNGNNPPIVRGPYMTQQLGEFFDHRSTEGFQSQMFYRCRTPTTESPTSTDRTSIRRTRHTRTSQPRIRTCEPLAPPPACGAVGSLLTVAARMLRSRSARAVLVMPPSAGSGRVAGLSEKGDQPVVPLSAERGADPLL